MLTLAFSLAAAFSARAEITVKEYMEPEDGSAFNQVYVLGAYHAFDWDNYRLGKDLGKKLYCRPESENLNGPEVNDFLSSYVLTLKNSKPEIYEKSVKEMPVIVVLLEALKWKYPCQKG